MYFNVYMYKKKYVISINQWRYVKTYRSKFNTYIMTKIYRFYTSLINFQSRIYTGDF